jgi:hypothetical protein
MAHSAQTAGSGATAKLKEKAFLYEGHGFSRAITTVNDDGFSLYECRDYALGGLVAVGVIGRGQAHGFSLDPNSVFYELNCRDR